MKHQDTETILDRFVAKQYAYAEGVALADVDLTDASRQNIRPTGVIEERVQQYATAMEQGDDFPALVLYKRGAKYKVLGGVHRIEAARRVGRPRFDAYVVDVDPVRDERTIEVLQRVLNMTHGANPSREERLLHALRFIDLGFNLEAAAAMALLKVAYVRNKQWAIEARDRAAELNVPVQPQESSMIEMGRIRNTELFKAVAELAHAARLNTDEIKQLSIEVREMDSEKAAFAVVERWREANADRIKATGGGRYQAPASKARNALYYLQQVERRINPDVFQSSTVHELDQAIASVESGIKKLRKVLGDLQAIRQKRAKHAVA